MNVVGIRIRRVDRDEPRVEELRLELVELIGVQRLDLVAQVRFVRRTANEVGTRARAVATVALIGRILESGRRVRDHMMARCIGQMR